MKVFIIACVAAIIVAVIGGVVLNSMPDTAAVAFTSPTSVRLGA
jgi:hypothetical protein